jgi:hypothetical protein
MAIRTKQVLKGDVNIGSSASQVDVTISSVTLAKSLLTFTYKTDTFNITEPQHAMVRAYFVNSTTIRFVRDTATGVGLNIRWSVREFTSGSNINVEHINTTSVSNGSTVAITNVGSISNAFVVASYTNSGTVSGDDDFLFPEITSTTQITNRMASGNIDDICYQIVSSSELSTQIAATGSITGASQSVSISSVNTSRTELYGYSSNDGNNFAFSWLGTVEVSSSTSLNFLFGASSSTKRAWAYVVEWPSNFTTYFGFTNSSSDSGSISYGPSSDITRCCSTELGLHRFSSARCGTETNDSWGVLSFRLTIGSTSSISWARGAGFSNFSTILVQVIEDTGPSTDPSSGLFGNSLVNAGLVNGGLAG